MLELAGQAWPYVLAVVEIAAVTAATIHVVLHKRDTRSVVGWVGLVWLAPIVGALAYWGLGVNRLQRKALSLRIRDAWTHRFVPLPLMPREIEVREDFLVRHPQLAGLARLVERLTAHPLLSGNLVRPLINGDEAYPQMLEAIDRAEESVALLSYIFDSDRAGEQFLERLVRAQERGVEVRVLIDALGSRYSRPNMVRRLRAVGIMVAAFLPARMARLLAYANLRNHRKILVVDGRIGFTGGTNIREGHWLSLAPKSPAQCLHFRLEGPVVLHLQEAFAIDWAFASGESLSGPHWFPEPVRAGDVWARGVPDGPDEDIDKMPLTLLGALSAAVESVYIVTPYFLPDTPLVQALHATALRGVSVHILLPSAVNIRLVQWASAAPLEELLERGCRVYQSPPPFDHTKLFLVDGAWALIGSTNWDARSLRLNFEYNVECYHGPLARELQSIVEQKLAASREMTLDDLAARSFPVRVRDGLARVLSPYL